MLVAEDVRTASILDIPICTEEIVQHLGKTGPPVILALRDKLFALRMMRSNGRMNSAASKTFTMTRWPR
jgi:hypothetical protein